LSAGNAPVPIYYGLNESHSNDWAQIARDGTIGIVYFEHDNSDHDTGNLTYKTIVNGVSKQEIIVSGNHLENSVLLFDTDSNPHIFLAESENSSQKITHYQQNVNGDWFSDEIINFQMTPGKFIYEISADIGDDGSFHLVVLKTRSNPDSNDYFYAYLDARLFYITNESGSWTKEMIKNYPTVFTMDEYSKMMNRQDIEVDSDGKVHIIFGNQLNPTDWSNANERLDYMTNKEGEWKSETAVEIKNYSRYSSGWYSSLCLDNENNPHISCATINRVQTGSAMNSKLVFASRKNGKWESEIIATNDDGYYGGDGRDYTGGLTHLVFDKNNIPHIIFSDIASSHNKGNYFNLGNIRYANKPADSWQIQKIYQSPLPGGRYNATEIYDICLLISDDTSEIHVIGQKLKIENEDNYSCTLLHKIIKSNQQNIDDIDEVNASEFELYQNHPNPFNSNTNIEFFIATRGEIELDIFNISGKHIKKLLSDNRSGGKYSVYWNGENEKGSLQNSGVYFYRLKNENLNKIRKMTFIK